MQGVSGQLGNRRLVWHPQSDHGMPGKGLGLDPRSQCSPTFFTSRHLWTMVLFVLGGGGRAELP